MTDQQKHLQQVLEHQQQVIVDINTLTNQLTTKKELALKLQGVIEYLEQTGVTLPEPEESIEEKKEKKVQEEGEVS